MDLQIIKNYADFVCIFNFGVTFENIFDQLQSNGAGKLDMAAVTVFFPVAKKPQQVGDVGVMKIEYQIF